MGHPALELPPYMTLDEFLVWDDGTDTRYELVDGGVVAMTPPAARHSRVSNNLGRAIGNRLGQPCQAYNEVGILIADADDTYFQADVAVSCSPLAGDAPYIPEPVVIVEVLSPSTKKHDHGIKVPLYRTLPSVQEIVLVSTASMEAEVWHRAQDGWAVTELAGADAVLRLESVDAEMTLAEVFEGLDFGDSGDTRAAG